jgi:N-acetylglucosaminyl-diphospho-decaprenol L-rhamnosyltransferase
VMFRRAFLREVGLFDERLFLYYEDTDLAWRGRTHGWRYRYVPTSVVRHEHAASSGGEASEVFRFHVERNRLCMLAKNAPLSMAARAVAVETNITWHTIVNEVLRPARHLHRPHPMITKQKLHSLSSYVALLPAMLTDRARLRRKRAASNVNRDLDRWILTK